MCFEKEVCGKILVISVLEPLMNVELSTALKTTLAEAIDEGHRRLALDLSNVDFIDSTSIVAMFSALRKLGDDGALGLFGVKQTVLDILQVTRIDRVIPIFPSREEALEVLSQG